MMPTIWLGALLTAALSLTAVGVLRWLLVRRGIYDHPGDRSSHSVPTPRGGGLGFVAAWLAWLGWLTLQGGWAPSRLMWLGIAAVGIALLGLWDDLRDVPARYRLAGQLAVASSLLAVYGGIEVAGGAPQSDTVWILWQVAAVMALLWLLNLYNFMDGIDGIAAWEGVFVAAGLAAVALARGDGVVALPAIGLAAAVIGFLPWNWPRARVFMGDAGSTTLGFALGALAIIGIDRGTFSIWIPAMLLSLFLVDATATLLLRIVQRERWYTAHRRHTYQILAARGHGHGRVVALYMAVNFLFVAPIVWWTRDSSAVQVWACIGMFALLTVLWGIARKREK